MIDPTHAYNAEAWLAQFCERDPDLLRQAIQECDDEDYAALLRLIERARQMQSVKKVMRPGFLERLGCEADPK